MESRGPSRESGGDGAEAASPTPSSVSSVNHCPMAQPTTRPQFLHDAIVTGTPFATVHHHLIYMTEKLFCRAGDVANNWLARCAALFFSFWPPMTATTRRSPPVRSFVNPGLQMIRSPGVQPAHVHGWNLGFFGRALCPWPSRGPFRRMPLDKKYKFIQKPLQRCRVRGWLHSRPPLNV